MISITPDLSLLAILVIFVANYFVVKKFLMEPVNGILLERETEIRDADTRYENAIASFNEATSEVEKKVQEAKREASRIREAQRSEANGHRAEVVQKTRAEATSMVTDAEQDLDRQVGQAKKTIDSEADVLARLAAERILGRALS